MSTTTAMSVSRSLRFLWTPWSVAASVVLDLHELDGDIGGIGVDRHEG